MQKLVRQLNKKNAEKFGFNATIYSVKFCRKSKLYFVHRFDPMVGNFLPAYSLVRRGEKQTVENFLRQKIASI